MPRTERVLPLANRASTLTEVNTVLEQLRYVPHVIITDTLASDGAAKREVLQSVEHRQRKRRNNRAENAHQPTRKRERRMRRSRRPGHAQRFLAAYGPIAGHCCPRRHRFAAVTYRATRDERFATRRAITGTPAMDWAATSARLTALPSASESPAPT